MWHVDFKSRDTFDFASMCLGWKLLKIIIIKALLVFLDIVVFMARVYSDVLGSSQIFMSVIYFLYQF